ncbi:MAG: preprotein translocase subunit YajC, partial [Methyloceanibacter sp.]
MFMTNIVIQVLLVLGVLIAAYLFLIGPQLKRITEHNRLLSSLKLGDQVVGAEFQREVQHPRPDMISGWFSGPQGVLPCHLIHT